MTRIAIYFVWRLGRLHQAMNLYPFRKLLGRDGRAAAWRKLGVQVEDPVDIGPRVEIPFNPKNVSIGSGSLLAGRLEIHAWESVSIGRNVIFDDSVRLLTGGHDPDSPHFAGRGGPISIGDYAWLPTQILVLPGVSIGRAAIVGSGSVVTKKVPDYSIVAGNPAKPIGERKRVEFTYNPALKLYPR